jgi:NAD(P)-dependent dehydrogenase (short-subunit alcohol dehydrogenase family)
MTTLPTPPTFRLDGRRALVTGAGRGIGLGAATCLATAGAHVTLCARSSGELDEAAASVRSRGHSVDTLRLDVTDLESMRNSVGAREPYEILVNNAGTNRPKLMVDVSDDDFDAIMSLNVRSSYFLSQAVAKQLLARGLAGSIINMSSQMGHVGGARRSLYCASKWAMEGFTRAMAIELAPSGIRVNTLCPTFIDTPMTKPFFKNPDFKSEVLSKIKIGRLGTVEDLMGAIVFLASDASSMVTGSSLMVDGGWTAE